MIMITSMGLAKLMVGRVFIGLGVGFGFAVSILPMMKIYLKCYISSCSGLIDDCILHLYRLILFILQK